MTTIKEQLLDALSKIKGKTLDKACAILNGFNIDYNEHFFDANIGTFSVTFRQEDKSYKLIGTYDEWDEEGCPVHVGDVNDLLK